MSNSGGGSEEGEILSDDDIIMPIAIVEAPLLLEDLSSLEEVFSSDYENSPMKNRRTKITGQGPIPMPSPVKDKRKEKENRQENVKRKCRRKKQQLGTPEANLHTKLSKSKRLKHKRRHFTSVSSDSDSDDKLSVVVKPKRKKVKAKLLTSGNSRAKNGLDSIDTITAKESKVNLSEQNSKVGASTWTNNDFPENSLKKRLMNMLKFSTPSPANDVEELAHDTIREATQISADKNNSPPNITAADIKTISVDKDKVVINDSTSNNLKSDLEKEVCTKLEIDMTSVPEPTVNCESVIGIIDDSIKMVDLPACPSLATKLDDDEDNLEILRALALKSSSSNQTHVVSKDTTKKDSDTEDDLTELRIQALHSAVLKKHKARKEKLLAKKAFQCLENSDTLKGPHNIPVSNVPDENWEENSLDSDKTTLLIDMDLDDTCDDVNVIISENVLSCTQPTLDAGSEYYAPEAWTPLDACSPDSSPAYFNQHISGKSTFQMFSPECLTNPYFGTPVHINQLLVQEQKIQTNNAADHSLSNISNITLSEQESVKVLNKYSKRPNLKEIVRTVSNFSPSKNTLLDNSTNKAVIKPFSDRSSVSLIKSTDYQTSILEPLSNGVESSATMFPRLNESQSFVEKAINIKPKKDCTYQNIQFPKLCNTSMYVEPCIPSHSLHFKPTIVPKPDKVDVSDAELENMDITTMIILDEVGGSSSPETALANTSTILASAPPIVPFLVPCPVPSYVVPKPRPTYIRVPLNKSFTSINNCIQGLQSMRPRAPLGLNMQHSTLMTQNISRNPFSKINLRPKLMVKSRNKTLSKSYVVQPSTTTNSRLKFVSTKTTPLPTSTFGVKKPAYSMTKMKPNVRATNASVHSSLSKQNYTQTINAKDSKSQFVIHLGEDSDSEEESKSPKKLSVQLPTRTIVNERAYPLNISKVKQMNLSTPSLEVQTFTAKLDAFLKASREKHDLLTTERNINATICTTQPAVLNGEIKPKATVTTTVVSTGGMKLCNGKKLAMSGPKSMTLVGTIVTPNNDNETKPGPLNNVNKSKTAILPSNSKACETKPKITVLGTVAPDSRTTLTSNLATHTKTDHNKAPNSLIPIIGTECYANNEESKAENTATLGMNCTGIKSSATRISKNETKVTEILSSESHLQSKCMKPLVASVLLNTELASNVVTVTESCKEKTSLENGKPQVSSTCEKSVPSNIKSLELELVESKLILNRETLLSEMANVLDQLEESSKCQQMIDLSNDVITKQKLIIVHAEQEIAKATKKVAFETQRKEETFKHIIESRKNVFQRRELCEKLQLQCINLGTDLQGEDYKWPKRLEIELRNKIVEVLKGISSIKTLSPIKKYVIETERCKSLSPVSSRQMVSLNKKSMSIGSDTSAYSLKRKSPLPNLQIESLNKKSTNIYINTSAHSLETTSSMANQIIGTSNEVPLAIASESSGISSKSTSPMANQRIGTSNEVPLAIANEYSGISSKSTSLMANQRIGTSNEVPLAIASESSGISSKSTFPMANQRIGTSNKVPLAIAKVASTNYLFSQQTRSFKDSYSKSYNPALHFKWKITDASSGRSQETTRIECPYEANGDCEDEFDCPFAHKRR